MGIWAHAVEGPHANQQVRVLENSYKSVVESADPSAS